MEKLPVQNREKFIKEILVNCPAIKRALTLTSCQECKYHDGTVSGKYITWPDGRVFKVPEGATFSNCAALYDVQNGLADIATIPVQIKCKYPRLLGLDYIWAIGRGN